MPTSDDLSFMRASMAERLTGRATRVRKTESKTAAGGNKSAEATLANLKCLVSPLAMQAYTLEVEHAVTPAGRFYLTFEWNADIQTLDRVEVDDGRKFEVISDERRHQSTRTCTRVLAIQVRA